MLFNDSFDWDNLKLKGLDAQNMSLTEPWEKDWPKILGVSEAKLRRAIRETCSHHLSTILNWLKTH